MAKGKGKKGGRPKLVSLSKALLGVGLISAIGGIGADTASQINTGMDNFMAELGLGIGIGLPAMALALKGAAHLSVGFGAKYRAFLRTYGLRP